MSTGWWTLLVGGLIGLGLAAFGARILLTGHAPALTAGAFRSVRDAGLYHLLFGLALALVVVGTSLAGTMWSAIATLAAIVLVGLAVVRFRPRRRRSPGSE